MRVQLLIPLLLFAGHVCVAQADTPPPLVTDVTPAELVTMMQSSPVTIYDCNEEENYTFAHLPGARLVIYDQITPELLPTDTGDVLVFYCYSPECPAASMAAHTAAGLGHGRVYCMKAGITGWQDAGLPTEP